MSSTIVTEQKTGAPKTNRQLLLNLITAALIALVVLGAFDKTVFTGAPISRVYQLGQRDTLYAKYFTAKREGYDASVYQYFVPSHSFLTKQLSSGVIPFWNPLVGCGAPFLADVETAVFWPFRILLLSLPPLRAWNLLIFFNILNFALGTFLLAKTMQLRRYAIAFASLTCAFCPFLIFQSELIGSSSSMIPLVMASFMYAESKGGFLAKALAGLACAIMILSGHPEPSFFGIASASLLLLCLSGFSQTAAESTGPISFLKRLSGAFISIAIIGAFAFCFCAFMLLPFLELLKHSDCYKLGLTGHRFGVPLNSILVNLVHPAYANSSPFLGILCLPLSLCAVVFGFRQDKYVKSLTISSLLLIALMCQLGPLDWLMNSAAFSWFVPKYCWPSLLVMLSLLSAFGFQLLVAEMQKNWRKASLCLVAGSLITVVCLSLIRFIPGLLDCVRQDEAFEHMALINKAWTRDIIILTVLSLTLCASRFLGKAQAAAVVLCVALCSIFSLAPVAKTASPVSAAFNYDAVAPIPFLQEQGERIITMGRHVFCPSSNFCYNINNIVPVNVYHPYRFQRYLISAGVTPEGVNQFFDGRLSSRVDMASVKFVVTPQPVLGESENVAPPQAVKNTAKSSWGEHNDLQLVAAGLLLYPENREIIGSLRLHVPAAQARELGVQAILMDEKNNIRWLGDIDRLVYLFSESPSSANTLELTRDIAVPLPEGKGKMQLLLQVFDWKTNHYLPVSDPTANKSANEKVVLAECDLESKTLQSPLIESCGIARFPRRFKLMQETDSHLRVYQNNAALPKAYLCHQYQLARNENEALKELENKSFDGTHKVLLEQTGNTKEGSADPSELQAIKNGQSIEPDAHGASLPAVTDKSLSAVTDKYEKLSYKREDCNTVKIDLETKSPALLVLTENYYPGWKATIEKAGSTGELKIMRANYLFQTVLVPSGKSTIRFKFQASGFGIGIALLLLASLATIASAALPRLSQARKQKQIQSQEKQ